MHNNQFQSSAAFHIEPIQLIPTVYWMTGFCMKCNTWLKWINLFNRSLLKAAVWTHNYFGKKSSKTIILGCLCVQKSWEIGNKIRKDEFFNWHHRLETGILINCNLPYTLFWLFSQTFWTRVSEYASEQILLCLYENQTKTYLARVNLAKLAGSIFTEVR